MLVRERVCLFVGARARVRVRARVCVCLCVYVSVFAIVFRMPQ